MQFLVANPRRKDDGESESKHFRVRYESSVLPHAQHGVVIPSQSALIATPHLDGGIVLFSAFSQNLIDRQGFDSLFSESFVIKTSCGQTEVREREMSLHLNTLPSSVFCIIELQLSLVDRFLNSYIWPVG